MRSVRSPGEKMNLRQQSIYLLPNMFTLAALFAGFYAVVQGMNNHFDYAAIAIFVAMLLDAIDGRVARLTHTQSAFGAEFDSLSDMVSFGVAPALVVYEWMLRSLGKLGWAAAFIYCAATALRLARFNSQLGVADRRYFQGLPSPSAAALVAGLLWVAQEMQWSGEVLPWIALAMTLFAGLSMVNGLRYYSFKEVHGRKTVPFFVLLLLLLLLVGIAIKPSVALFILFVLYALSAYGLTLYRWLRPNN